MKQIGKFIQLTLISSLIAGCSSAQLEDADAQSYPEGSYCMKGGRAHNYSCDVAATNQQTVPMHPKTVDEQWMYETLDDIREWLKSERLKRETPETSPENAQD